MLEKLHKDKHSISLQIFANYGQLKKIDTCAQLFTAVSYDFHNKLERLSLARLSSLV
jgi:hypothetical protein